MTKTKRPGLPGRLLKETLNNSEFPRAKDGFVQTFLKWTEHSSLVERCATGAPYDNGASGWFSGRAASKAGNAMHSASIARIVGYGAISTLKRRAL